MNVKGYSWKFLWLTLSSFTLLSSVYSMEEAKHDFSKTYVISVTRETVDDLNYPKLTLEEQNAVFGTLMSILVENTDLPKALSQSIEKDEQFFKDFSTYYDSTYQKINKHTVEDLGNLTPKILLQYLDERKKDYDWFFAKLNEELKSTQQRELQTIQNFSELTGLIESFISSKIETVTESAKGKNKFYDQKTLSLKVDQFGVTLLKKDLLNLISFKEISKFFLNRTEGVIKQESSKELNRFADLKAKCQRNPYFFKTRQKENELVLEKIKKISHSIAKKDYLIVFNEMFFGKADENKNLEKYAPLSFEEFDNVSKQIINLSQEVPSAFFHVNFLYFNDKKMSGGEYKGLVNDFKEKWPQNLGENVDSFFYHPDFEISELLLSLQDDTDYLTFQNESFIYSSGKMVGSYRKVSYKDEANSFLTTKSIKEKTALYIFGEGEDTGKKIVSTDICYDLEIGARSRLNSYPFEGQMHVVVSNTLPLKLDDKDKVTEKRFNNLPDKIPLILHVDPHEQDLFLNPANMTIFLGEPIIKETPYDIYKTSKQGNLVTHQPLYHPIRLVVGENVFSFKIWDVSAALEKLNEY